MDDVPGAHAPPLRVPPAPVRAWLALALSAPVGPSVCRRLRERFPDPAPLGHLLADALGGDARTSRAARTALAGPRGPLTPAHVAALGASATGRRVDETLRWLADDPLADVVAIDDPRYPAALAETLDPPPVLYLRGASETLAGPAVAVVGSRDATHGGREHARRIAAGLAASGVVVVSGLALGLDAAAHAGALESGGRTLAFMATGADDIYPRRHRDLAEAMLARGGALASEFPLRHPPRPWCFPQRNRLISGASLGVVVVEAKLPSGSLTTARHALEQGREVMAVPGAVDNPASAGCHALIRDGAALVTSANDVLQTLAAPLARTLAEATASMPLATPRPMPPPPPAPAPPALQGDAERRIAAGLASGPATLERLLERSGLDVVTLIAALSRLEIAGTIVVDSGGRYAARGTV